MQRKFTFQILTRKVRLVNKKVFVFAEWIFLPTQLYPSFCTIARVFRSPALFPLRFKPINSILVSPLINISCFVTSLTRRLLGIVIFSAKNGICTGSNPRPGTHATNCAMGLEFSKPKTQHRICPPPHHSLSAENDKAMFADTTGYLHFVFTLSEKFCI